MPITRTYAVGDNKSVVRLDNLTGPWNDVSILSYDIGTLFDVETDPLNSDIVFVVGQGDGTTNYGIYSSSDAGATWNVPAGTYQSVSTFNEVQVLDSNTVYAVGQYGYLAKSTDAGATFNLSTQIPSVVPCIGCNPQIEDAYSLHFISDQIGVVGLETHVFKTIDAGVTWTVLNSGNPIYYNPLGINQINGIHISADEQTIVLTCRDGIYLSTDAGATFTVAASLNSLGTHLTWVDDSNLLAFGLSSQILKTTDGGLTWTTLSALFPSVQNNYSAGHLYTLQNGFYGGFRYIYNTNDGAVSATVSLAPPTNNYVFYAVWTGYFPPVCYLLSDCKGEKEPKILKWDILADFVGSVIQVTDLYGTTCWQVTEAESCEGATIITGQHTIVEYQNCIFCDPPMCYELVFCDNSQQPIIIGGQFIDLSGSVGQVIKICDTQTNNCYCVTVNEIGPCTNGGDLPAGYIIEEGACFLNCADCNPPVIPTGLKTRSVKPGYDTPGCHPEYTEKVSCTFAEQVFDEVAVLRYGIKICCDHDIDKWDLKKSILDLKAIYDPGLLPIKSCYCYRILQTAGTVNYKYISCEGCLEEVTLVGEQTLYICSQSYPKAYCPLDASYQIIKSTTVCTDNASCQPPPCSCYKIINNNKVDAIISYADCQTGQTIEKTLVYLQENYFCVSGVITVVSAENPFLVSVEVLGTNCSTDSECQPV